MEAFFQTLLPSGFVCAAKSSRYASHSKGERIRVRRIRSIRGREKGRGDVEVDELREGTLDGRRELV